MAIHQCNSTPEQSCLIVENISASLVSETVRIVKFLPNAVTPVTDTDLRAGDEESNDI